MSSNSNPRNVEWMVTKLLENYLSDLQYNVSNGVESCNNVTCGTPYFETENEMIDYLDHVESVVSTLKEDK